MGTLTTNLSLYKPGHREKGWHALMNDSMDIIDAQIHAGLKKDGSVALTANWDAGAFDIRAATLTADGLTSGRVVFAGTNGLLSDDASLIFNTTNNNLGLVATSFGTNAVGVFGIGAGTAPTTSPADIIQMWAADRSGTAGRCGLHIRTEDGTSYVFADRVGFGTTTPSTTVEIVTPADHGIMLTPASGNAAIGFGGIVSAGAAASLIYSDTNFIVINSKAGSQLYLNYDNANAASTVNFFNGVAVMTQLGNFGIKTAAFGTNAVGVFAIGAGTAPTTSPADISQIWSADVNAAAGYAWLHGRDEKGHTLIVAGVVLKTDTGHPANPHEGIIEINTFDNKVNIYGDAAWREMATW